MNASHPVATLRVPTAPAATSGGAVPRRPFVRVDIEEGDVRGYAIGDRVSQPQYGTGTIRLVDEYHTVIDFDEHGIRRFSTTMVKLERSATPEPGKPAKRTRRKAVAKTS